MRRGFDGKHNVRAWKTGRDLEPKLTGPEVPVVPPDRTGAESRPLGPCSELGLWVLGPGDRPRPRHNARRGVVLQSTVISLPRFCRL